MNRVKWTKEKEQVEAGISWEQIHTSSNGYQINARVTTDCADAIGQTVLYQSWVNLYNPEGKRIKHFRDTWINKYADAKNTRKERVQECYDIVKELEPS